MGHHLNFFMEFMEATKAQVAAANWKVSSIEMLAYKAKGQASEAKQEFQQVGRHANTMMDDAKNNAKKLK